MLMSLEESYNYMFDALSNHYAEMHDNELGAMLGGFDKSHRGKPFDPAAWHDWIDAVRKVTSNETITENEALKAMLVLLKEYNDHHGFDLSKVIEFFDKLVNP
jgi:hypothetical protein